jgi:hypothetical protein
MSDSKIKVLPIAVPSDAEKAHSEDATQLIVLADVSSNAGTTLWAGHLIIRSHPPSDEIA